MKTLLTFMFGALAVLLRAGADDWPRFRGVDGAGIGDVPGLPAKWSETNQLWRIKLPGTGHSSPVICGSRLFATCAEIATAKRIVVCLDAGSGRMLWQREFPSKSYQQNNDNSYASATPATDSNGVVMVWTTPDEVLLVALDNDGAEIWRRSLGPFVCNHGSGSSPIIAGGLVVLNNDQDDPISMPQNYPKSDPPKPAGKSFVIALDRQTGATRWQLDRKSNQASFATPCTRTTESGALEIIVASTAHGLTGVDAATGAINWTGGGTFTKRCVASPAVGAGLVVTTEGSGGMGARLVAVRPGAKTEIAYELQKPLPYVPSPLIVGDHLYLWGDNGLVACLRAATGETIWRERVEGSFYSSPICVNNSILNITRTGDAIFLGGGDKFEILSRIPLGEKSFATPAIANGILFLRTFSQIIALGVRH
jgi:outer membrane protein assembly factor BamB